MGSKKTEPTISINKIFELNLRAERWRNQGFRALICAQSGGGKTNLKAVIIEEVHAIGLGFLLVDPMNDFRSLRDLGRVKVISKKAGDYELTYPSGDWLKPAIQHLAKGEGVVIDLSGLRAASDKRVAYTWLVDALLEHQEKARRPMFFGVEEAHLFAPAKRMQDVEALQKTAEINRLGRRMGINSIFSSQRPADIEADVRSQCNLHFIGHLEDALDYKAVEHKLTLPNLNGKTPKPPRGMRTTRIFKSPSFYDVMGLETGHFYVRFGEQLHLVYVRKRKTEHIGQTPVIQMSLWG